MRKGIAMIMKINDSMEFRKIRGHIEVYFDGEFMFSADDMSEAEKELRKLKLDEMDI